MITTKSLTHPDDPIVYATRVSGRRRIFSKSGIANLHVYDSPLFLDQFVYTRRR
jgi:hypothetical protein